MRERSRSKGKSPQRSEKATGENLVEFQITKETQESTRDRTKDEPT